MYTPLVCTSNSLGAIDYGIPVIANKSTDYRTAYGFGHRFVPNVPQDFDCRVKTAIKNDLLRSDLTVKQESTKSDHGANFVKKAPPEGFIRYGVAHHCMDVSYTRTVQEQMFQNPPRPMVHDMSEMKEMYQQKCATHGDKLLDPPAVFARCDLKSLGRDEQPGIPPEGQGFWKWLDPYLSETRAAHVPFTKNQQDGVARKDIETFYDVSGVPKCKGFGPKDPPPTEPLQPIRKAIINDKVVFKLPILGRVVYSPIKRVPNSGMKTEYRGNYTRHTYSDMYPYLFENGVSFEDSLPGPNPWQCLAAPGTFCTESCHIGTGWSVSAVVDTKRPKTTIVHKPCCIKVQTQ